MPDSHQDLKAKNAALSTVARNLLSSLKQKQAAFDKLEEESNAKRAENRDLRQRIEAWGFT